LNAAGLGGIRYIDAAAIPRRFADAEKELAGMRTSGIPSNASPKKRIQMTPMNSRKPPDGVV